MLGLEACATMPSKLNMVLNTEKKITNTIQLFTTAHGRNSPLDGIRKTMREKTFVFNGGKILLREQMSL
jgi:hypothetical protein